MSFFLANTATSTVIFSAITMSKLIIALVAFTKYQNLMLETSGLNASSHVTKHIAKTIWIYK